MLSYGNDDPASRMHSFCKYPLIILYILFISDAVMAQGYEQEYFICWSGDIEGSPDRIAYYATDRQQCSRGEVTLIYEEFVRDMGERPVYRISDSISLESDCPGSCVYITRCLNEQNEYLYYFLLVDQTKLRDEFFTEYQRAWRYNKETKTIIPTSVMLVCRNNGYDQ